jgi:hypothetical protein
MYRATVVYALMLILAGAALWAVLALGSRLKAPTDLAGRWTVDSADAGHSDQIPDTFSFEQSGRFAMLRLDGRAPVALTLQNQSATEDSISVRLDFTNPSSTLTAIGPPGGDDFEFQLAGPVTAQFHAHRTWRTYAPVDSQSTSTKAPTTKP